MAEGGHVNVYESGSGSGDYMHMALHTLMSSVCNYLECQVPGTAQVSDKSSSPDMDGMLQFKLDQAADLVKKHLLCSVREEMDAMKGKLSDLEMKIYRLEVENTLLLREYVPAEILEQRRMTNEYIDGVGDHQQDRWTTAVTTATSSYSCSCAFVGGQQQLGAAVSPYRNESAQEMHSLPSAPNLVVTTSPNVGAPSKESTR